LLFDIAHLLRVRLIALILHIDHCIGVYEMNEFRFADSFAGYGFAFMECDCILGTVGDTEEGFIDCIVRYEVCDVCEITRLDAGFFLQFPSREDLAFRCRATCGGIKEISIVGVVGIVLYQQIVTIYVPD
jgi:hypothetical protein